MKVFFTPDETRRLLQAGAQYGLRGKIHGEELAVSGGVEVGVECNALSVDHLEAMDDHDIELLKDAETITKPLCPEHTLLPELCHLHQAER